MNTLLQKYSLFLLCTALTPGLYSAADSYDGIPYFTSSPPLYSEEDDALDDKNPLFFLPSPGEIQHDQNQLAIPSNSVAQPLPSHLHDMPYSQEVAPVSFLALLTSTDTDIPSLPPYEFLPAPSTQIGRSPSLVELPLLSDQDNNSSSSVEQESPLPSQRQKRPRGSAKQYACSHPGCKYAATQASHLTKHMRTHTGEKPYKCTHPGCDYAAAQSSRLTEHMRTHSGEKPYKCTYSGCDYAAAINKTLKNHISTHTRSSTTTKRRRTLTAPAAQTTNSAQDNLLISNNNLFDNQTEPIE